MVEIDKQSYIQTLAGSVISSFFAIVYELKNWTANIRIRTKATKGIHNKITVN